jgi:hypothetical protein
MYAIYAMLSIKTDKGSHPSSNNIAAYGMLSFVRRILDIIRDVIPDVSCFESQSQASLNSMFGKNTRNKMMLEVQTNKNIRHRC